MRARQGLSGQRTKNILRIRQALIHGKQSTSVRCQAARHGIVPDAFLMHNERMGNPATVTALPAIIQFFRSHGYRFVAL
jgi:hypothetical protein